MKCLGCETELISVKEKHLGYCDECFSKLSKCERECDEKVSRVSVNLQSEVEQTFNRHGLKKAPKLECRWELVYGGYNV